MTAAVATLVVVAGCSSSDETSEPDRYDRFREVYVDYVTHGDEFKDPPPALTDEQIDAAIERVCVYGEPNLDEADEIGQSIAGPDDVATNLGSAVIAAVRGVGC